MRAFQGHESAHGTLIHRRGTFRTCDCDHFPLPVSSLRLDEEKELNPPPSQNPRLAVFGRTIDHGRLPPTQPHSRSAEDQGVLLRNSGVDFR